MWGGRGTQQTEFRADIRVCLVFRRDSELISRDHPDLPKEEVAAVIERTRELLKA